MIIDPDIGKRHNAGQNFRFLTARPSDVYRNPFLEFTICTFHALLNTLKMFILKLYLRHYLQYLGSSFGVRKCKMKESGMSVFYTYV